MDEEQLKATIRCLHKIYYDSAFLESPEKLLKFHRHLEALFNYAGIEETLTENNPDEMSPEKLKQMYGIVE